MSNNTNESEEEFKFIKEKVKVDEEGNSNVGEFNNLENHILRQKGIFRPELFTAVKHVIYLLFSLIGGFALTILLLLIHQDLTSQLHWVVVIFSTLCLTATVLTIVLSKAILTHVNEEKKPSEDHAKTIESAAKITAELKKLIESHPISEIIKN